MLALRRTATAKGAAGKRQSGNGKPPPRLSMVYGDELSSDRVFKARESVFAPGDQLDTDSEDELYHGEESPLPDELLAKSKQGRDLSVRTPNICTAWLLCGVLFPEEQGGLPQCC